MKKVILDGKNIVNIRDVHEKLATTLDFGPYYGHNLDALWDVLTTDIERPFLIEWKNSKLSKDLLGNDFDKLVNILQKVADYDKQMNLTDKMTFSVS